MCEGTPTPFRTELCSYGLIASSLATGVFSFIGLWVSASHCEAGLHWLSLSDNEDLLDFDFFSSVVF